LCWLWEKYSRRSEGQLPPTFKSVDVVQLLEKNALHERKAKVAWAGRRKFPRLESLAALFRELQNESSACLRSPSSAAERSLIRMRRRFNVSKDARLLPSATREELMARQLCERFQINGGFSDVKTMLAEARPNVVHITTPPQSHHSLAKLCLDPGLSRLCREALHPQHDGSRLTSSSMPKAKS